MWFNIANQIQTDIYYKIRSTHSLKKSKHYRANKRRRATMQSLNSKTKTFLGRYLCKIK